MTGQSLTVALRAGDGATGTISVPAPVVKASSMIVGAQVALNAAPEPSPGETELEQWETELAARSVGFPNGLGPGQKFFSGNSGSFSTAIATYKLGWFKGKRPSFCGEQWVPSQFASLLASPPDPIWNQTTIDQEPQVNWKNAGINAPATTQGSMKWWQASATQAVAMRNASPNASKVKIMLDLTQYYSVGTPLIPGLDWTAAKGIGIDYIGGDCYSQVGENKTAATMFSWLVAASQGLGIPWCAPELGLHGDLNDPANVALVESWFAYLFAHGCAYVTWWNSGDCALDNTAVGAYINSLITV